MSDRYVYAMSSDFEEHGANPVLPTGTRKATTPPASLRTSISPPPARIRATDASPRPTPRRKSKGPAVDLPDSAALEAGLTSILPDQQLQYWSTHLAKHIDSSPTSPLLPIPAFRNLYTSNAAPGPGPSYWSSGDPHAPSYHDGGGKHFVIHQHDHPVAGLHYDLRLQINGTSSVSWAIMYGLPGDPNSKARVNRNATETRVHCLWNHLIETASARTGSMLIWDTGEYEVLPYHSSTAREPETSSDDDDDGIDDDDSEATMAPSDSRRDHIPNHERQCSSRSASSEQEKLHQSFQNRKIRLRLHGSRLPPDYTITLRLSSSAPDFPHPSQSISSSRKRKRKQTTTMPETPRSTPPTPSDIDDDDDDDDTDGVEKPDPEERQRRIAEDNNAEQTRATNAYPGATNSIGSVHQRTWYLSLDRAGSGFVRGPRGQHGRRGRAAQWIRARRRPREEEEEDEPVGFEPFYVLGRDVERSVVTGRKAEQVLRDEGVEGFVSRRGWRGKV